LDQRFVGDGFDGDADAEQGAEGGLSGAAAVEAEDKLDTAGGDGLAGADGRLKLAAAPKEPRTISLSVR
jgi:hypothetical protein